MIDEPTKNGVLKLIETFQIEQMLDDYAAENFCWDVKGSGLLSRTYLDKNVYLKEALYRLRNCLLPGGTLNIIETYTDGDVLIIEVQGNMRAKNNHDYNNQYCWIIRFKDNKITRITAYLDTLLLDNILISNEK